jgi:hypothetical protein
MTASRNRARLGLEQIEDRCTPSAALGDFPAHHPVPRGGPDAPTAHVRDAGGHEVPIKLTAQCLGDIGSFNASGTGFGTGGLGRWTAQGRIDTVAIGATHGAINGTLTVVTANGDRLFVSFTTSWELATGKGEEVITVTGGTGRFAGASGRAVLECTVTRDPATQAVTCDCQGSGALILAHPRHDAVSRGR